MYAHVGISHAGSCADAVGKATNKAAIVNSRTKVIADIFVLFLVVFIFISQIFKIKPQYVISLYLSISTLRIKLGKKVVSNKFIAFYRYA